MPGELSQLYNKEYHLYSYGPNSVGRDDIAKALVHWDGPSIFKCNNLFLTEIGHKIFRTNLAGFADSTGHGVTTDRTENEFGRLRADAVVFFLLLNLQLLSFGIRGEGRCQRRARHEFLDRFARRLPRGHSVMIGFEGIKHFLK